MLFLPFLLTLKLHEPDSGEDGPSPDTDTVFFARADVRAKHAELIERERTLNNRRFELSKRRNDRLMKGDRPNAEEDVALRAEEEAVEAETRELQEEKRKLREGEEKAHAAYKAKRAAQLAQDKRAENL
jgi:hypothetical protein